MPLATSVAVVAVLLPLERRLRLAELGVRPGCRIKVLTKTAGGGRVVAVGDARLAISHWIAERLETDPSGLETTTPEGGRGRLR